MTASPRYFAGLDEAGYGPLLGPLTYGFSVFRCESGEGPTWTRLEAGAAPAARGAGERVVVADSKQVFDRTPRGAARLESTALAFLRQRQGSGPRDGRGLLDTAPPALAPSDALLEEHPWYACLPASLPAHAATSELDDRTKRLAAALDGAALEVADVGARVVPVAALNREFDATGNKGAAHWRLGGAIVEDLFERFASEGLDLTCDRLGGRKRYGPHLSDLVPWSEVRILREEPAWSEYEVRRDASWMRIRFVEKGDRHWFAVALASCLAKYARETVMDAFNRYFEGRAPGLKPTAGYVQDGRRWLVDAAPATDDLPKRCLVRSR